MKENIFVLDHVLKYRPVRSIYGNFQELIGTSKLTRIIHLEITLENDRKGIVEESIKESKIDHEQEEKERESEYNEIRFINLFVNI